MAPDPVTDESYTQPNIPPATPPVIDPAASPEDAARLADVSGDSDRSGTRIASVDRGGEDEEIAPGDTPAEIAPDQGDVVEPAQPDEVRPDQGGDIVQPGAVPDGTELPPD